MRELKRGTHRPCAHLIAFVLAFVAAAGIGFGQVLHYAFDENMGSPSAPIVDSGTPPAANGTPKGEATRIWDPARGGVLDLSANGGVGNWVDGGDADKLDGLSGLTVLMWVNLRARPSNTSILASDLDEFQVLPGESGWSFDIGGDASKCHISMNVGNNLSTSGQGSLHGIDADQKWVMVAGTFANSTHVAAVYYGDAATPMVADGRSYLSNRTLLPNSSNFKVGNMSTPSPANWVIPAWIDELQVYDRVLTLSELEEVRVTTIPEARVLGLVAVGAFPLTSRRRARR